ncbi:hypothetical protein P9112_003132 [Eukaryota sp. TZLM1-RC]
MHSGSHFRDPLQVLPTSVTFSIFNKSEVENLSVCKVSNPILFDSLSNPCQNGLYDPRMGPLNPFENCATCKLNHQSCPGHMGHIELPFPVFNPLVFPTLYSLMRAKCFNCHKLRISRTKADPIITTIKSMAQGPIQRAAIKTFISKMPPKCDNCGAVTPKLRKEGVVKIFILPLSQRGRRVNAGIGVDMKLPPFLTPKDVYEHLKQTFGLEYDLLHVLCPGTTVFGTEGHDFFFIQSLPVPPSRFRPPSKMGDQTYEHPSNGLLGKILSTRRDLLRSAKPVSNKDNDNKGDEGENLEGEVDETRGEGETQIDYHNRIQRTLSCYFQLQHDVNTYLDATKNPNPPYGGKIIPGVRQLLEKKEGLFRQNMMGKRVNYAARSVISTDPYIATTEVGVPQVFAMKLTFPEPVTPYNSEILRNAVQNGPNVYPGANFVEDQKGNLIDLAHLSKDRREGIAKLLQTPSGHPSNLPKRVYRHLTNGDVLLVNRQPTLHKASIMAHKAKVLPNQRTIRLHYANCNSYNADFDGDEMNLHFPQSFEARSEAYNLALADKMYTTPTAGNPIRGLIQDHVMGGFFLTLKNTFLSRPIYTQLVYSALSTDSSLFSQKLVTIPPAVLKPKPLWTGKQVISTVIRLIVGEGVPLPNITAKGKVSAKIWTPLHEEEASFLMRGGDLLTGVIDKNQIGPSKFGLVHSVCELYGHTAAGRLLSSLGRLFTTTVQYFGCSIGVADMILTEEADDSRNQILSVANQKGQEVAAKFAAQELTGDYENDGSDLTTDQVKASLGRILHDEELAPRLDGSYAGALAQLAGDVIDATVPKGQMVSFPYNNLMTMATIGAKGSNVNVSQISCLLGQQALEGRRVPVMPSGRTLPSFSPYDLSPRAGGFVQQRFLTGIKPQEYYFHCMAGREGLIDTAVKTANSGYLQRCVIKALESLTLAYDGTVRESDGSVIQFLYGEDGLSTQDTKFLTEFKFMASNFKPLIHSAQLACILPKLDLNAARTAKFDVETGGDPVLSRLSPFNCLGAVSEYFSDALEEYISSNPDGLVSLNSDLSPDKFRTLMHYRYQQSLAHPGDSVGAVCGQSIGEPSTQMTLNTFHLAGHGAANVTLGIPRLREIIMTAAKVPKTPTMTLPLVVGSTKKEAYKLAKNLSRIGVSDVWGGLTVTSSLELKKGSQGARVYKLEIDINNEEVMKRNNVTSTQLSNTLENKFLPKLIVAITRDLKKSGDQSTVVSQTTFERERKYLYRLEKAAIEGKEDDNEQDIGKTMDDDSDSDHDSDVEVLEDSDKKTRVKEYDDDDDEVEAEGSDMEEEVEGEDLDVKGEEEMGQEDELNAKVKKNDGAKGSFSHPFIRGYSVNNDSFSLTLQIPARLRKILMLTVAEKVAKTVYVREIKGITKGHVNQSNTQSTPVITTDGVNFEAAWSLRSRIDINKMATNDIYQTLLNYGVEACRTSIIREINNVFSSYGIDVDLRHLALLSDFMTFEGQYRALNRIGMDNSNSPFLKMSFETTASFLTKAVLFKENEDLTTPSARIIVGQPMKSGTGLCELRYPMEISSN